MRHQQHERIDRVIQITDKYGTFDRTIISLGPPDDQTDYVRANAERSAQEDGVTYVAIVTQRVTWRGKNGKRTYTEIDREVIKGNEQ